MSSLLLPRTLTRCALSVMILDQLSGGAAAVGRPPFNRHAASLAACQGGALTHYLDYIDREWPGNATQHAITSRALSLLLQAIDEVAGTQAPPSTQLVRSLEPVRGLVATYDGGPHDRGAQSATLQRIFLGLTDVLERLVAASGRLEEPVDPRLSALRRSAESLDLRVPLRRQPDVLERFFHHAGEALRRSAR